MHEAFPRSWSRPSQFCFLPIFLPLHFILTLICSRVRMKNVGNEPSMHAQRSGEPGAMIAACEFGKSINFLLLLVSSL